MNKDLRYLLVLFVSIVLLPVQVSAQWTMSVNEAQWSIHRTSGQVDKSSNLMGRSLLSPTTPTYASRMMSSGGAYSSSPTIDSNGKAVFTYYSKNVGSAVTGLQSGPRKVIIIDKPGEDDEWLPIGDAVLPLCLCTMLYLLFCFFKQRVSIRKKE